MPAPTAPAPPSPLSAPSLKDAELPEPLAALSGFLCWFVDADLDGETDEAVAARYARTEPAAGRARARASGRAILSRPDAELPWDEIGAAANRAFTGPADARDWLTRMLAFIPD